MEGRTLLIRMRILNKAVFEGLWPKWITLITFRPIVTPERRLWRPKFCGLSRNKPLGLQDTDPRGLGYGERRLILEVVGAEPFVAAVTAFAEGWSYGREEVSVGGAVVVHDALEALAVAG